jgi:hypothetical protein
MREFIQVVTPKRGDVFSGFRVRVRVRVRELRWEIWHTGSHAEEAHGYVLRSVDRVRFRVKVRARVRVRDRVRVRVRVRVRARARARARCKVRPSLASCPCSRWSATRSSPASN